MFFKVVVSKIPEGLTSEDCAECEMEYPEYMIEADSVQELGQIMNKENLTKLIHIELVPDINIISKN